MSNKININGKELAFTEGQTIFQVAKKAGVFIPSLCYHDKTGPASKCRVCVVEVEGMRGLQTSCSTTASSGMKVETKTETVLEAQKTIVNLILSNGEHNCLFCEKNGNCELQDVAYYLGIEKPQFVVEEEQNQIDNSSEMISRDHGKCIQCGRCISGCNTTVVNEVLDFGYRASSTQVVCDGNLPMGDSSCVQCGECSQLCPTGAILDKKSAGFGRPWEMEKVDSICSYCGVGCKITIHVNKERNQIAKVTGVDDNPVNHGMLCVKGRYGYDFIQSEERLTTPLIRDKKGGKLRTATWDEAIKKVADNFTRIKKDHGSNAIGGMASAKVTNEENYIFQKFIRAKVGTNNVDHCARL